MLQQVANIALTLSLLPCLALAEAKTEPGSYQIDPMHSKVGFEVPHLVISSVEGKFKTFDGKIELNKDFAKSVVTANKALLASHGADLYNAAEKAGVDLYYEAAVAGAIPIIRPLRESLIGDRINRVMGIVNGTTNFILTKMDEENLPFDVVLKEAQALGYAEADPTADVEGHDAAAKAAILAGLAFHTRVTDEDVYCEGITKISDVDIKVANALGLTIKLLAIAQINNGDNKKSISVRVHPTLISQKHPLAAVREAFNAVFVEAESAGQMMFYGKGAGGEPTASAVLGDVVAVARHRFSGGIGPKESDYADLKIESISGAY